MSERDMDVMCHPGMGSSRSQAIDSQGLMENNEHTTLRVYRGRCTGVTLLSASPASGVDDVQG